MGFVTRYFIRPKKSQLLELPSGSFTIGADGNIMGSTLPCSFPISLIREMSTKIRTAFGSAQHAGLRLNELIIHFPKLKIVARQAKDSVIVFVVPRSLGVPY